MTDNTLATLHRLNFAPPCYEWSRPDPRGANYGTWFVRQMPNQNIHVRFAPADPQNAAFSMQFETLPNFERWVKQTL